MGSGSGVSFSSLVKVMKSGTDSKLGVVPLGIEAVVVQILVLGLAFSLHEA